MHRNHLLSAPVSPMTIDGKFEKQANRGAGKESTNGGLCTYIFAQ
jgi:hypothetical protein